MICNDFSDDSHKYKKRCHEGTDEPTNEFDDRPIHETDGFDRLGGGLQAGRGAGLSATEIGAGFGHDHDGRQGFGGGGGPFCSDG